MVTGRTLDDAGLAAEAGVEPAYVRELASSGAITRDSAGRFETDDIARVRLAAALAQAGIDTDALVWAIEHKVLAMSRIRGFWRVPEPGGRRYAEFATSLGSQESRLSRLYMAFGLAEPPGDALVSADEEAIITEFLDLWADVDPEPELAARAARIAGDGVRRLQLATLDLFDEWNGAPPQREARGLEPEAAFRPSILIGALIPRLLVWLQGRHLEGEIFGRIVTSVQSRLAEEGRIEHVAFDPAVAFVDLTDYTALTSSVGDAAAAELATRLDDLAADAVRSGTGARVVKLLGDGVMLRFSGAEEGCRAVLSLMDAIVANGLPDAHAGLAAGPLVVRDGDIYGSTVNLASRISAFASRGELLVNAQAAAYLERSTIGLDEVGEATLKGIPTPVNLWRVRR